MTAKWFGKAGLHLAAGNINWQSGTSHTFKVMLTTSTYTPNQDTHLYRNDVTNEVTGTGYTAGGVTVTTPTQAYDGASNTTRLDADDVSWTSSSFTARYAVVYRARGGLSSADELLGYVDFGADQTVSSGTFSIVWDATDGVLRLVAA